VREYGGLTKAAFCGIMPPITDLVSTKAVTEKSTQGDADREARPWIESLARRKPAEVRS
jgi:hypothetical protein